MDPETSSGRRPSEVHEDQQLHVDAEAFGALLLDEVRDLRARHEVDVDVLILVAAPFADLANAMRTHQRETLRKHPWRSIKLAEPFDPLGREARLLLQLLDSGALGRRIGVLVADEPGGKLDAAAVRRHPRLVDQDHLALIFGEDDDRADVVGAARIFPFAALERTHVLARPHELGRRQVIEVHSSISLSGISLASSAERGKCSESTAPTRSIAAQMPSAGRPARTSLINAVMASPQV